MEQPSQHAMTEGLPKGFPPTREHLHDSEPMASELQRRLDEIGKRNLGQCPDGSQAGAYLSEK